MSARLIPVSLLVKISCVHMNFLVFRRDVCYNEAVLLQPFCIEDEVQKMAVSYKKLFKILIDRDMKKKEFRDFVGISYSTMSKLEKGENTTVEVLEKICLKLGCGIEDIMEILPDTPIQKAQSNFQKKGIHKIEVGFKAVPFLNIISISYPLLLSGM